MVGDQEAPGRAPRLGRQLNRSSFIRRRRGCGAVQMWERLEVDETLPVEDSVLLVAFLRWWSISELYSHAKEVARFLPPEGRVQEVRVALLVLSSSGGGHRRRRLARLRSNQSIRAREEADNLLAGDGSPFDDSRNMPTASSPSRGQLGGRRCLNRSEMVRVPPSLQARF